MSFFAQSQELTHQMERMFRHLQLDRRNVLLIASVPDADLERALAEELARRLRGPVREFRFAPDQLDLAAFFGALPLPEGGNVVFAFGLDDLPSADRQRAIEMLNLGRETLRWSGHSLVLWLRLSGVRELALQAPDTYAVRSGQFDFDLPPDPALRKQAFAALQLRGPATPEELRQRYLDYVLTTYRLLDFRGLLQVRNLVRLRLEDVFVPLAVEEEGRRREEEARWLREMGAREEGRADIPPDFLLRESQKRRVTMGEALREYARLVILGDPGSGKSTLLRYLALTFAEGAEAARERLGLPEIRLPILLPIAAYALALRSAPATLLDFLPRHFAALGLPDLDPLFEAEMQTGRALLLLDGLDEVLDAEARAAIARQVEALAAAYPGNRIVVTSRIAGYSGGALGMTFATLTVCPFERPEIERFAQQWSRAYEALSVEGGAGSGERGGWGVEDGGELPPEAEVRAETRAKNLTGAIFANPAIERLATTPLLLTLLALIHHLGTRLPARRVDLYRLCVEALAETWNLARSLSGKPIELWPGERRLDERAVVEILAPLASAMHECQPGGLIGRAALEAEVARGLEGQRGEPPEHARQLAHEFVELIREQVGLLVERGPDQFGFMHLTFEEYLAARFLAERRHEDRMALLRPHLHDPRWREVILLTAASLFGDHAGDFVCAIRDANSPLNDVLHLDLFLAARCLADDVPVEPQLQQELVNDVATLALRGDFKKLRDEAMMLIETLRGTGAMHQAERVLVAALRDEDWRVRESAAEALGRMRAASDAASSALLELLGDENARLRWRAASALGRLGQDSQAATDALLALAHSNDWKVRESVMIGLGQTGVTTGEVVGAVRTAVSDQDQWVRASANWALEQLRSSAETEAIATGQIARKHVGEIAELVTDLQDSDWRVRERAIMLLGEVGAGSGLVASGLVAVALQEDEDPRVRESAARALALIGVTSDEVIGGLLTTLWKADGEVRRAAATALGRLGHSSDLVASALIAALRDRDADLRTGAALAIGRLDFPTMKALSALRRRLRDPEAKVADAAFVALWQLVPKLFESKKGSRSTASDGDYPTR